MDDDLPVPELPGLELDEGALRGAAPATTTAYQVRVGAIRDPVDAAPALAEILGVDLGTASRIAMNAPGVIVDGASRDTAERMARQVEALGIKARVQEHGAAETISTRPPPPGAPPSRPPSVRPAEPPRPSPGAADSFWAQAPVAFIAPFLGKGALLLGAAGLNGVGVALMAVVPGMCLKLAFLIGLQLIAFGLFVEVFNRLAQAAIYREDDSLLPEPHGDLPDMKTLFWRGVANFFVFALLAAPVIALSIYSRQTALVMASPVLLFLYWPMGLTVQSISGRLTGALDVISVGRGIVAAPLEYFVVCVLTAAAIGGSTFAVLSVAGASVFAAGAVGGGALTGVGVYALVAFVWYAAIGYFHGVLGYLMGALVRSKPDAYEFLQE